MPQDRYSTLLYRALVVLAVVLAFFLTLVVPQHMRESTDWSFYYATQNFAAGRLAVDGAALAVQKGEAAQYGAELGQYVQIGGDRWALTESPGYIFFMLPFYLARVPALGNFALAAGMAAAAFLLLKRLAGEKAACLGSILLIFTPVMMAMMQRVYADTFAAAAFLSMGGGVYLYDRLSAGEHTPGRSRLLLFLSGLALGMAVFANYLNALAVSVFLLHMIFSAAWESSGRTRERRSPLWVLPGLALPLAGLMIYQAAVFGAPWTIGLSYAQAGVGFSTRYWLANVKYVTVALLVGFPLILPAATALLTAGWRRVSAVIAGEKQPAEADALPGVPADVLLVLAGWICAVFGLYYFYEWTATPMVTGMPYITMARYYLPAALPLTVLAALWLKVVPRKLGAVAASVALVWGIAFFAQAALSYPVVPAKSPYNPLMNFHAAQSDGSMLSISTSASPSLGGADE
jgi:hypothetical protein